MTPRFIQLKNGGAGYLVSLLVLLAVAALGYGAAHYMETHGHYVSGMNNQVVWGLPHVFAILLILGASGSLNVASMGSVLGRTAYKPWARLSALLSAALLVGGLLVLVLDLGRPERLIVAMTHYNFRSVFAWNIFLYTGLLAVIVLYLWTLFEPGAGRFSRYAGALAFGWRFILTSGTGAIFGFLVARQFYDAAMLIPMFIVLSLMVGTAAFILLSALLVRWSGASIEGTMLGNLTRLLCLFVLTELLLVAGFHLTNLYTAEHQGIERFILFGGGVYTMLFWLGQIGIGSLLPLLLVYGRGAHERVTGALLVSSLVLVGALCQLYVTIIGGQAYPLVLFPGKDVRSEFFDGAVALYTPSMPEFLLGAGGIAVALLVVIGGTRILPFLPWHSTEQPTR